MILVRALVVVDIVVVANILALVRHPSPVPVPPRCPRNQCRSSEWCSGNGRSHRR